MLIGRFSVVLLFVLGVSFSQNDSSRLYSGQFIQNKVYLNGKEKQILNNFSICLTDSLGQSYKPSIYGEYIDVKDVSNIVNWYKVVLKYEKYVLEVNVPSKMFLPIEGKSTLNEKILWEWNITKEISDDTISYTCTFLLSLIDSEIELSLPATCHYKDVEM